MIALALAIASGALGGWLAWHHPVAPAAASIAFAAAAVAAYLRPRAWLYVLPALIPLLSFAPWTGWIVVEEIDILALALATGGYARWVAQRWGRGQGATPRPEGRRRRARVSIVALGLMVLFALSVACGLGRGIIDAHGGQWSWYDGYYEALNSVRIGKSFALALLLAPLLFVAQGESGERAIERLAIGFAAGGGVAALAVVWERMAFTGLLNFSADYRATGMFWEMHVGGAALDGFLALAVPFVVWAFIRSSGRQFVAAAGLALLVSYACLATFSRGVYLALPISLSLLILLLLPARGATSSHRLLALAKGVLAIAMTAVASYFVFRAGGYRSLLAVLGVLAIALHLSNAERGTTIAHWIVAAGLGGMLGVVGAATASLIPKGPYVVYAFAFAICLGLAVLPRPAGRSAWRAPVALAAFGWLAFAAGHVASHWGGNSARQDVAFVLLALVVLVLLRTRSTAPSWPERLREQGIVVASTTMIAAVVAVMSGGAYMGDRFATSRHDFDARIAHWRDGLSLLSTPSEWLLGKGLGRFPEDYYFSIRDAVFPGSYRIANEEGNGLLVLSGPRYPTSFGDVLRIAQRVPAVRGPYTVAFDARAPVPAEIHIEVCEQHLLYNGACAFAAAPVRIKGDAWQRHVVILDGHELRGGAWYAPKLAFFSLAVASLGHRVDFDNISVLGPSGQYLVENGDFENGMARWFIISERHHLPWHIKNLAFNVLFDQGAAGLALFALLVIGALWRLIAGRARGHPLSPFIAASLVGFLIVGVFDSLLDVPRVALAFYLVLFAGLALRKPKDGSSAPAD